MNKVYKLVGHEVVPCASTEEWARDFEKVENRRVAYDEVGDRRVSTVFLGIDHNYGDGPPLLFETMVFPLNNFDEEICERCSTWEQAEAQHARILKQVQDQQKEKP